MDICAIGQLQLISGSDEALADARNIPLTFLVDNILAYKIWLLDHDAVILQDITKVPTGYSMHVR